MFHERYTVLSDGLFTTPTEIDTAKDFTVTVNGSIVVPCHVTQNCIYLADCRVGDVVNIKGVQRITSGNTTGNTPLQAERKVQYKPPSHSHFAATLLARKFIRDQTSESFPLTREELEYLVTAGRAILKHLKEVEDNEATNS